MRAAASKRIRRNDVKSRRLNARVGRRLLLLLRRPFRVQSGPGQHTITGVRGRSAVMAATAVPSMFRCASPRLPMCVFGEDESHTDRRGRRRRQFLPRPAHTDRRNKTRRRRTEQLERPTQGPARSSQLGEDASLSLAQTFIDALRAPSLSSASSSSSPLLPRAFRFHFSQ